MKNIYFNPVFRKNDSADARERLRISGVSLKDSWQNSDHFSLLNFKNPSRGSKVSTHSTKAELKTGFLAVSSKSYLGRLRSLLWI